MEARLALRSRFPRTQKVDPTRDRRHLKAVSLLRALAALLPLTLVGCVLPIIGAHSGGSAERNDDGSVGRPKPNGTRARARASQADGGDRSPGATALPAPNAIEHAGECYAALDARGVVFERVANKDAGGVRFPTRLLGPVEGITVATHNPNDSHEILDCRLALALTEWARVLRRAGVRRLEHYSMYRPGARVGGKGRASGHAHGLALDAARFELEDGSVLDVLTDWEERDRGESPCPKRGHEARPSRVLRSIVCEAIDQQLFQVVLTPHHDKAHENHVHLEVRPDVDWTYVR